ncbi:MAG: hemolysin [Brevundimonas sp.]|uniref:hemolysin n=1 Tax=Brevundimonas sp. TaxID=1871086 RepID=UPI00271BDBCA|nr:hemolysin [Brevundimonas sp.]MDO9607335.1 hemolysin [Brevundimonas sp.]
MKTTFILSSLMAAGLALSACAQTPATAPAPGGETAFKACKVEDYQAYVGRNRSAVPAAPLGQSFRVLCATCAATMDYRENRVNFVYDDASGVIQQVKCG